MIKYIVSVLLFVLALVSAEAPVHVHLAYGALDTDMQVTFASKSACSSSNVLYGTDSTLNNNVNATRTRFESGNSLGHQYVYNALLENLTPGQKYYYVCLCDGEKTDMFHFNAKLTGNDWVPNLLVFGGT